MHIQTPDGIHHTTSDIMSSLVSAYVKEYLKDKCNFNVVYLKNGKYEIQLKEAVSNVTIINGFLDLNTMLEEDK